MEKPGKSSDGRSSGIPPIRTYRGERPRNPFDFCGDDIAPSEVRIVEDAAQYPLGEQMLDEHVFDRGVTEVRIDGGASGFHEIGKSVG